MNNLSSIQWLIILLKFSAIMHSFIQRPHSKCSYQIDYYFIGPRIGWNEFCALEFSTAQIDCFGNNIFVVYHRDQNMTATNEVARQNIRQNNLIGRERESHTAYPALSQKQNSIIFNFARQRHCCRFAWLTEIRIWYRAWATGPYHGSIYILFS